MKKLRLYMITFCVLLTLPLAFVAWRTYGALDREAQAQVRFFSERLLDEIEAELADLVRREENWVVGGCCCVVVQESGNIRSPLARVSVETFILGYFQNNPDGFHRSRDGPGIDPFFLPSGTGENVSDQIVFFSPADSQAEAGKVAASQFRDHRLQAMMAARAAPGVTIRLYGVTIIGGACSSA